MELNPYDPPRPALEAPTGANPPDEPRYKQVLRGGRSSDLWAVRLLLYALVVLDACVTTVATIYVVFGAEWEPEADSDAVLGVIIGFGALGITLCAVLITAYFLSWLRWFDRLCGFGTILIFLIGFAIVALNR